MLMLAVIVLVVQVASTHENSAPARGDTATSLEDTRSPRGKDPAGARITPAPEHEKRAEFKRDPEKERVKRLTVIGNRMKSIAQIDSLKDMSEEDKAFLKRRYRQLHPLD